jgi:hypothetical protein
VLTASAAADVLHTVPDVATDARWEHSPEPSGGILNVGQLLLDVAQACDSLFPFHNTSPMPQAPLFFYVPTQDTTQRTLTPHSAVVNATFEMCFSCHSLLFLHHASNPNGPSTRSVCECAAVCVCKAGFRCHPSTGLKSDSIGASVSWCPHLPGPVGSRTDRHRVRVKLSTPTPALDDAIHASDVRLHVKLSTPTPALGDVMHASDVRMHASHMRSW